MNGRIFIVAVVALFAGGALAEGFKPWGDVLSAADTDKSGGISKAECDHHPDAGKFPGFGPWFRNHFTDTDADKNGEITMAEMMASMKAIQVSDDALLKNWREAPGFRPKSGEDKQSHVTSQASPEMRKDMAVMYQKMAECLRTDASPEACQRKVAKHCPVLAKTGRCPLHEGISRMKASQASH